MEPVRLDPPDGRAAVVVTPLTATYFYLVAAFSFGLAGDLAARPSIYPDRKSTRLNSSHSQISYAVFCLKKKKTRLISTYLRILVNSPSFPCSLTYAATAAIWPIAQPFRELLISQPLLASWSLLIRTEFF